jgi:hypothetical protein
MAILAAFATFQIVGEHYLRGIEASLAAAALLFIREVLVKRIDEGTLPIVVSAGSVSPISDRAPGRFGRPPATEFQSTSAVEARMKSNDAQPRATKSTSPSRPAGPPRFRFWPVDRSLQRVLASIAGLVVAVGIFTAIARVYHSMRGR